jgi:hypothetical protein
MMVLLTTKDDEKDNDLTHPSPHQPSQHPVIILGYVGR